MSSEGAVVQETTSAKPWYANIFQIINKPPVPVIFSVICTITFISITIYYMISYVGGDDNYNTINPKVGNIVWSTLLCGLCLGLTTFFYFSTDSTYVITYIIIIVSISVALSYSSLAVSAVKKNCT
jgi:hypothetical protein